MVKAPGEDPIKKAQRLRAEIDLKKRELEEAVRAANEIERKLMGSRAVASCAAFKELFLNIPKMDDQAFGKVLTEISPQAYPKEANVGKRFGLSDKEIEEAKDRGVSLARRILSGQ